MSWFQAPRPLLPELIGFNARWRARQPALVCEDQVQDWQTLDRRVSQVASVLLQRGLERGQRVAVLMQNSAGMVEALFGILRAGGVAVPLNLSVADAGIAGMLRDAGAVAVIASDEQCRRVETLRLAGEVSLPLERCLGVAAPPGWTEFAGARDAAPVLDSMPELQPDDLCNIIYSSGTTGLPKGIVHSHGCRMAWAEDLSFALRYHSGCVTLCSLGLYSNISWVAMMGTILGGGTLVVMPRFEARDVLALMQRHRVTHSAMVPVQYQRILELPDFDHFDIHALKSLMCCGSPLPVAIKRQALQRFGCDFIELYGLTEGLITVLDPEDAAERLESVGRPIPSTDIRILDDQDREVPAGECGEIVGLSRVIMAGYHGRDDASADATWTDPRGRRWLRTGDIGRVDAEGFLYVVDRKKDMIISGGQNIYPADIEAVLLEHPDVREVAVVGVPSETWGETPLAVVVPAREAGGSEAAAEAVAEAIRAWVNPRLGKQQRVSAIVFRDALPRNPNGKVLKRELRQQFREQAQSLSA